jgi:hypothetical protein
MANKANDTGSITWKNSSGSGVVIAKDNVRVTSPY